MPINSYHGGAFFDAIGNEFDRLHNIDDVISADVLDAWFPPAPSVLDALSTHLDWSLRTSPPTNCEGLIKRIAEARGIPQASILPGAGSSSLIFLALTRWLSADSRVLILDPSYGEYAHVAEHVVGCQVERLTLDADDGFILHPERLLQALRRDFDFVVLVNPNNPTGRHLPKRELIDVLNSAPSETLIWIDETYVDYVDTAESMEEYAAESGNVVVCKSMSKAYALSGVRVGYLCTNPHRITDLRRYTPPWSVSLPGQMSAVMALGEPDYYRSRYAETHTLREQLSSQLAEIADFTQIPSVANYVLCRLPEDAPTAPELLARCRAENLFLRDASLTAPSLDDRWFRIAVKDAETNGRMTEIIRRALTLE